MVNVFTLHATCSGARTWSARLSLAQPLCFCSGGNRYAFASVPQDSCLFVPPHFLPRLVSKYIKTSESFCPSLCQPNRTLEGSRDLRPPSQNYAWEEACRKMNIIYLVTDESGGDLWRRCAWRRTSFEHDAGAWRVHKLTEQTLPVLNSPFIKF